MATTSAAGATTATEESVPDVFSAAPNEIFLRVAQFLSARDALQMAATCRSWRREVSLSHLAPTVLFENIRRSGHNVTGDHKIRGFLLPVTSTTCPRFVHSVTLRLAFVDQGWGNRKGQVWVVAHDAATTADLPLKVAGELPGRVVAASPTAEHTQKNWQCEFQPRDDEVYYVWFRVGGGGGHTLLLRHVQLHIVLWDDSAQRYSQNYNLLTQHGLLSSSSSVFLADADAATLSSGRASTDRGPNSWTSEMLLGILRTIREWPADQGPPQEKLPHLFKILETMAIETTSEEALDSLHGILVAQEDMAQLLSIERDFTIEKRNRVEAEQAAARAAAGQGRADDFRRNAEDEQNAAAAAERHARLLQHHQNFVQQQRLRAEQLRRGRTGGGVNRAAGGIRSHYGALRPVGSSITSGALGGARAGIRTRITINHGTTTGINRRSVGRRAGGRGRR